MAYSHKRYGLGIKVDSSIASEKVKVLSERYKKKGRPKKSDYDYMTYPELIVKHKTMRLLQLSKLCRDNIFGVYKNGV